MSSHTISGSVPELTAALAEIENQPKYQASDWGYSVLDQKTGEVLAAQNADHLFDPGSTMKTYAVSTALRLYGSDYRFRTPVYRVGDVTGGSLNGNLVLVGSGDLSLGLREQPDGTLYYENFPDFDQSYATLGIPGAVEPPGNPLAGLDQLASMVRNSGITHVAGDVVIDDRLFTPFSGFPDGLISPIWVNENLIDALVTPGTATRAGPHRRRWPLFTGMPPRRRMRRRCSTRFRSWARAGPWRTSCRTRPQPDMHRSRPATASW